MVMTPKVPVLQQADIFGKGPQIAVVGLGSDECGYDIRQLQSQTRLVGHPHGWNGREKIFADECSGPRHQWRGRLPVAHAEHLEHARVGLWGAQQPVGDVRVNSLAYRPGESELGGW